MRGGAVDHLPVRSDGRDVQSHARGPARLPPLRRHQASSDCVRGRDHWPAASVRSRRAGPPLRSGRAGAKVRGLGDAQPGAGRVGRLPRDRCDRHALARDARVSRRHDADCDRRPGPGLRPIDAVAGEHRIGGQRVLPGGRDLRQRRVHPGASDRDAGRGQVPPHLGVDSRRGRTRVDLSRRQAVVLPRRDVSGVRQPGAARYCDPRDSQGRVRDEARHRRPTAGLPRRQPSRSRGAESQGRGRARNLREVCRTGSAQGSDEDFPGDALLDGRPVGGLPSADQRAGAVRGGRVRVPVSWRESARAPTRCCHACTAEISRSRR